jgi:hypothetical protein
VRCTACGCFRIDPPRISGDEESAHFYTDYYSKEEWANAGEGAPRPAALTRVREMLRQWRRGDYKEALWHAMNEAGARYARLIKAGPMVYAVARREGGS